MKFINTKKKSLTFATTPQGEALGIFKGLALFLRGKRSVLEEELATEKVRPWGALLVFVFLLSFLLPLSASAGVIRKPPNNLGLMLYFPMNEGSGTIVGDASGNGRHGTFAGNPIITPGWNNGKFGKALDFSGTAPSTGRIDITALNVTTTHTVSMWIYLTQNCTNYGNLFAYDGDVGLYCYVSGASNRITYYYGGDHFNTTNISLNQWHHIAVTNNAGSATFYLDGVADGTAASASAYSATTIGNDSLSEDFPGRIDELRVYNRALSATEIATIYRAGSAKIGLTDLSPGTLKNNLTGHWTFDGKDMISNVADVSGNGNNGTLSGFTSTTTVVGKIGQGLTFDGTNDYVNIPNTSGTLKPGTGDFSVSLWYKGKGGNFITDNGSIGTGFWAIGTTRFYFSGASLSGWATGTYTLPSDNDWHHLVLTLNRTPNPDTYTTYLDGVVLSHTFGGGSNGQNIPSTAAYIGLENAFTADLNRTGHIDDVRTWNRALSASEIKQVYNLGAGQKVSTTKTPVGTLADGLVGHWTFDGGDTDWGTNIVTDKSGNGNNGTIMSIATSTGAVIGKSGQALTFNGTSSYINLGNSATWEPDESTSFAVSLWYKTKRAQDIFLSHPASGIANFWYIRTDQAVFCGGESCGVSVSKTYTLPSDNDWHNLVVVLNRSTSPDSLTAYIDGVSQGAATGTLDNDPTTWGASTSIGRTGFASGGTYRQGPMDDVRIYNRALSASEVKQLYNLGK